MCKIMCRVHLHTKSLQHLSPCYLSPHTLHTLPPNLTIMDYLPYSKPHHANHLLPCQPLPIMPYAPPGGLQESLRGFLHPCSKMPFFMKTCLEDTSPISTVLHTALLYTSYLFCNTMSTYHLRL